MSPTLLLCTALLAAPPALKPGYAPTVAVSAPTRLDWTFTVATRSLAEPPANMLDNGFDSTKQTYELFLPPRKDAKQPIPAILFVSAGDEPGGWKAFQPACEKLGFAFIGVRGAGNGVAGPKRCRIVLDCFDDVRRQVPLDPDRTYISGFSGGGRIACGIGFALPELFGGLLPIGAGGDLRPEEWLRHRAADRLSAALITGQTDFNRGEVERWKGPFWKEIGIRSRVWVQPNMGHAVPPAATLTEAIGWLDEGKASRAALAKKYPASRMLPYGAASRADAAKALSAEAKMKMTGKDTMYAGLMLLQGVSDRWPDLEAGKAARKLLEEYDTKADRPWEKDDIAEQRKLLIAEARALGDYAIRGIPAGSPYIKSQPDMAKKAILLWTRVIDDSPSSDAAKEGRKAVTELEPLAGKGK